MVSTYNLRHDHDVLQARVSDVGWRRACCTTVFKVLTDTSRSFVKCLIMKRAKAVNTAGRWLQHVFRTELYIEHSIARYCMTKFELIIKRRIIWRLLKLLRVATLDDYFNSSVQVIEFQPQVSSFL